MEIRTGDPIGIRCPQGRKRHARHTTVSAWPASQTTRSSTDHDRRRDAARARPGRPHPDHHPAALPRRSHHRLVPRASGADLPADHGHPLDRARRRHRRHGAHRLVPQWSTQPRRLAVGELPPRVLVVQASVTNLGAFAGVSITMPDPSPLAGGRSIMVARHSSHIDAIVPCSCSRTPTDSPATPSRKTSSGPRRWISSATAHRTCGSTGPHRVRKCSSRSNNSPPRCPTTAPV